ncbi:MAG: ATP-binding protein [Synechococcales bacterium]|nr:ATP-binding protein [Synechococcales bacterium]
MKTNTTPNWETANLHVLMVALDGVRRALQRQVAHVQNRPIVEATEEVPRPLSSDLMPPAALDQLCTQFKLSPFERDILVLCAGMELDASFPLLCAEAQGDLQRPYPTFSLALATFTAKHWNAIAPHKPLRHWRLIEVGPGAALTLSPLRIDERVLHYLLGEQFLDRRLVGLVRPISNKGGVSDLFQPSHQAIAEQLINHLQPSPTSSTSGIQLCGGEALTKWAIATTACAKLGRQLYRMPVQVLPTGTEDLFNWMILWQREALLSQNVLLLDADEIGGVDGAKQGAIAQLLDQMTVPWILSVRERSPLPHCPMLTLTVPDLSVAEQRQIWQEMLGDARSALNGQVDQLVSQFNLSLSAIQSACLNAQSQLNGHAEDPGRLHQALWDACRHQARPRLEDLAQPIAATSTWDDLVLPDAQKQILHEIEAHVRQRAKVYDRWGFASKGSRGLGISALFVGASGTGKTMAAEVLATALKLDLYRIDLSAVISKYIGETEKNLRRIFDAAEAGGAILLFDEADAIFGKRSEVKDSHDRHANIEVSYLLQRMEAYQGLAILTTNLKDALDQAFMRRIRFVVRFPFPDGPQRREIWQRIFPKDMPRTFDGTEDIKKLARLNIAGGNIRSIALNAAFLAAQAEESVDMKHLLAATRSEYVKLERTLTEAEIKGWIEEPHYSHFSH